VGLEDVTLVDKRFANDQQLGTWLRELRGMELFQAQLELENRILSSSRSRLESLSLTSADLGLEYTRVRSEMDVIKRLQAQRERLIEERNNNPRIPALKEKKTNV
jgi:hypothetical protein